MAGNKKPRRKAGGPKGPKGIYIKQDGEDYKMHKIWPGDKIAPDPFFISDSLAELLEEYDIRCTKYRIKPQLDRINELKKEHELKNQTRDEPTNFFEGNFDRR